MRLTFLRTFILAFFFLALLPSPLFSSSDSEDDLLSDLKRAVEQIKESALTQKLKKTKSKKNQRKKTKEVKHAKVDRAPFFSPIILEENRRKSTKEDILTLNEFSELIEGVLTQTEEVLPSFSQKEIEEKVNETPKSEALKSEASSQPVVILNRTHVFPSVNNATGQKEDERKPSATPVYDEHKAKIYSDKEKYTWDIAETEKPQTPFFSAEGSTLMPASYAPKVSVVVPQGGGVLNSEPEEKNISSEHPLLPERVLESKLKKMENDLQDRIKQSDEAYKKEIEKLLSLPRREVAEPSSPDQLQPSYPIYEKQEKLAIESMTRAFEKSPELAWQMIPEVVLPKIDMLSKNPNKEENDLSRDLFFTMRGVPNSPSSYILAPETTIERQQRKGVKDLQEYALKDVVSLVRIFDAKLINNLTSGNLDVVKKELTKAQSLLDTIKTVRLIRINGGYESLIARLLNRELSDIDRMGTLIVLLEDISSGEHTFPPHILALIQDEAEKFKNKTAKEGEEKVIIESAVCKIDELTKKDLLLASTQFNNLSAVERFLTTGERVEGLGPEAQVKMVMSLLQGRVEVLSKQVAIELTNAPKGSQREKDLCVIEGMCEGIEVQVKEIGKIGKGFEKGNESK